MTWWDKIHPKMPKGTTEAPKGLVIRVLADYSEGQHTRINRWNPDTGEKYIADALTGEPRPWPILGVILEGDVPKTVILPTTTVARGRNQGYMTLVSPSVKHEPGGPPEDPWRITHTFEPCKEIHIHTVDGDVKYKVIHNPGKYVDEDELHSKLRVDWFYIGERMN